jgi:hypothetical protein
MDKLEAYLDQVCRGIAGPRSLRQHIRQELREHLTDAVAEHRAAGLSDQAALDRALEDFGGPEQVRSELEATHGHRVMAVIIDKAMQWKENTMKAKWLWTTWAHLMLMLIIAVELIFITMAMIFIVPKFQQMVQEGWIGGEQREARDMIGLSRGVIGVAGLFCDYGLWVLIAIAAIWVLFEWKAKGGNKPFIRLSALGTAALGLLVMVVLTSAALVLPMIMTIPSIVSRPPEVMVDWQVETLDSSIASLEEARKWGDWGAIVQDASRAERAAGILANIGAAAPVIASADRQARIDELRSRLRTASAYLRQARTAAAQQDAAGLEAAMKKFHETYPAQPTTRQVR